MNRAHLRGGKLRWAAVMLVVGGLVVGACGSSKDAGTGAVTTAAAAATTAAGAVTTAAGAATTAAAAATGAPIKVMTESAIDTNLTPYENIRDGSKYFAQWVNDQGGLKDGNGTLHKLEVTFCDDKYDANESANCARKAVDQKLVANIGGFTIDAS